LRQRRFAPTAVHLYSGMPFAFPPESTFTFTGIPSRHVDGVELCYTYRKRYVQQIHIFEFHQSMDDDGQEWNTIRLRFCVR
jgi:hypothetical protein